MKKRLRYIGSHPAGFVTADVGEVQPGEVFEVPAEHAPRFLQRLDVEDASDAPKPRARKPGTRTRATQQQPPAPVVDDTASPAGDDDTSTAE